jgi:hypothetical protein
VIYASFVKRLNEFTDLPAIEIGELTTNQAGKRAEQEQKSYVALLQFEIDMVQNGRLIINSQNLQVYCYVYETKTGKRIVKDKTYYQPIGGMGTRTSGDLGTPPVKITPESAGVSAAEQLRSGLLLFLRA